MAIKSIIDVEVNDSQFTAFHSLFKEYESALAAMPEGWKDIGGAINATAHDFQKVSGGTLDALKMSAMQSAILARGINGAVKAQKEFHGTTERSGDAMGKLVDKSANLAKNIFGISKFLIKTALLGSGVFGGALFGLDKLAGSAMNTQRDARGLGVSAGQLEAFKLNYGRFVDPEAVLGKISHAQGDLTERVFLGQAVGMSQDKTATANPEQLAMTAVMRAHDWWANAPVQSRTEQGAVPSGLLQVFSFEEMRRLGNTPRETLLAAQKSTSRDEHSLGFNDRTADAWANLHIQLKRAGVMIETVLISKLGILAPKFTELSVALTKGIANLITKAMSKENIAAFSKAMDSFSNYLGSGEFQKNLSEFGEAIGNFARIIKAIADWTGLTGDDSSKPPAAKPKSWLGDTRDGLDMSVQEDWDKSNAAARAVYVKHKAQAEKGSDGHNGISKTTQQKTNVTVTINNSSFANVATSINALSPSPAGLSFLPPNLFGHK